MPKCEHSETCIFFNDQMAGMPSTATAFKKVFCEDEFDTCGRYMISKAIGRENLPNDLFPNQVDRAKRIIKTHKTDM